MRRKQVICVTCRWWIYCSLKHSEKIIGCLEWKQTALHGVKAEKDLGLITNLPLSSKYLRAEEKNHAFKTFILFCVSDLPKILFLWSALVWIPCEILMEYHFRFAVSRMGALWEWAILSKPCKGPLDHGKWWLYSVQKGMKEKEGGQKESTKGMREKKGEQKEGRVAPKKRGRERERRPYWESEGETKVNRNISRTMLLSNKKKC